MRITLTGPALLLMAVLLIAGLSSCSDEPRIKEGFKNLAETKCEDLLGTCMREGRLRCVCDYNFRKTDEPSIPYEGVVFLRSTTGRLGKGRRLRDHEDIFPFQYVSGRWVELPPRIKTKPNRPYRPELPRP